MIKIECEKYQVIKDMMYRLNRDKAIGLNKNVTMKGFIVFTEDSFDVEYTECQRTYWFTNDNKAFKDNMSGYSIFGSCIDGTDNCMRLDKYIKEEHGEWTVEKCWVVIEEETL